MKRNDAQTMTMEDIITSLYGKHWTKEDLEALEITVKQVIEEDRKRRYQQRVRN